MGTDDSLVQAFVIGDLNRSRSPILLDEVQSLFPTTIQPAVWVHNLDFLLSDQVNVDAFRARHLRDPLAGEIGCALAHRAVYQAIAGMSSSWGVVFEDDAEIIEGRRLASQLNVLRKTLPRDIPVIVNLNFSAATRPMFVPVDRRIGLWKPWVPTYTTTSYFLNKAAARRLLENQTPISSQADWPVAKGDVLFFHTANNFVRAPESEASLVDPASSRTRFPLRKKIKVWSGWWYIRNRSFFPGATGYWSIVLLPRILRHIYRAR